MPATNFNDPVLLVNGDLKVSGPFDTEGADLLGEVTIRFLLIQRGVNPGDPALIVDDVTNWTSSQGDWETTIPASRVPQGLRASAVQAIGQAIVVRRVAPDPVPFFETLTWSVQKEVVRS